MWDEAKLERNGSIREELIEELISIQIHSTNPTKTTKIGTLLLEGV